MAAKPSAAPPTAPGGDSGPLFETPTGRLLTDGPVRLVVAAMVFASLFYVLPFPAQINLFATSEFFPLLFQGLILVALRRDLRRLETPERQFWNDLTAAHGSWFSAHLVALWASNPHTHAESLTIDSLYCVYYLALVLAIERRVHRLHAWRPTALERALAWPGAVLFVLGLLLYFVLVPGFRGSLYQSDLPSYALYLSLDLYLAATFLYLARTSAEPRWRSIYLGLGTAYGAVLAADLMEALLYRVRGVALWGSALDLLWILPSVLLVLAIRRRHLRFSPPDAASVTQARAEENLSGPSGRTMTTALAFPFLHFFCFRFGLLEEHRDLREIVVLVWVALLASVAAIQYKMLHSRLERMYREREEFEGSLRDGEKDLRIMVERVHSQQQIWETEQKFTKAFHANPDAMALSTRSEGRVLEVNASFIEISGLAAEDILGKKATELGMWQTPENRQRMLSSLERAGRIRDQETLVPWSTGGTRVVSVSVEPLDIADEPCLLTVFQALSGNRQGDLFDHSEAAIVLLNREDQVVYWNESAEVLYGWPRHEALGRPADELWLTVPPNALLEIRDRLIQHGPWCGEMTHHTKGGQALVVESWWSRVDDPASSGSGSQPAQGGLLFFGFPTATRSP